MNFRAKFAQFDENGNVLVPVFPVTIAKEQQRIDGVDSGAEGVHTDTERAETYDTLSEADFQAMIEAANKIEEPNTKSNNNNTNAGVNSSSNNNNNDNGRFRYENIVKRQCLACHKHIDSNQQFAYHENGVWHAECFKCHKCSSSFGDQVQFIPHLTKSKQYKIHCVPCHNKKKSNQTGCGVCKGPINQAEDRVMYDEKQYHNNCFSCLSCRKPLDLKSFYTNTDGTFSCTDCENWVRCGKCADPIKDNQYPFVNGKPMHMNCITCETCNTHLEQPYIINDKLYCKDHSSK
eukprot:Pgem_evm1s1506